MDPVRTLDVDEIDLSDLDFWARPMPEREGAFAVLRAERPISFHPEPPNPFGEAGPGFWAITRHADVCEVSRRPDLFCSGQGSVSVADMNQEALEFFGSIIVMDDPRHQRLRSLVSRGFTPRQLQRVQGDVERLAAEIVDRVADRGECDFVTDVAAHLPLRVICDMMGIPPSQYDFVFRQSNVILGASDPEYLPEGVDPVTAVMTAGMELAQLMDELASERQARPTDDLTSVLVNAEVDGGRLTHQEVASFFILLAVAGNETTRNALSWGVLALSEHPEQRAALLSDFDAVIPTAVEEVVRWASPVVWMRRTVTTDGARLGDHTFSAGEKVLLYYHSANRDEAVFDDPLRFDVRRSPNDHIAFGGPGPHHCLGAHLARREITVLYRELFRRLPDLEVAGEPERLLSSFINGIKHLPVRFTPAR